ncbi:hypothetical protein HZA55_00210 [Candidatus Poribacteria bacterium]|nr:hypothetical protein [Candidatus Poribacteria bacterium]
MNRIIVLFFCIFILTSCDIKSDKLCVFKIDHVPNEADWKNSLPFNISIEKGKLNHIAARTKKLDSETIHKSNKTCHHVQSNKEVIATIMAFYTDDMFFIRISWADQNMDDKPAIWDESKNAWNKTKGSEDGLGILWNLSDGKSNNCSSNCHFDDWEVKNSMLTPYSKMKTKKEKKYNIWSWWAGRNKKYIGNTLLDSTGIHEDKQILTDNSKPSIICESFYSNGLWTVTIISPLTYFDIANKKNITDNIYKFQMAFFDNSYSDHSITPKIENILFIKNKIPRHETKDLL